MQCGNLPSPAVGEISPNRISQKPSLARSVLANWIGHAVAIVCGFILPRFINDHVGQVRLGIWDLGWSTVAYLNLLTAGITSSVNRYIARYEAKGDWVQLNRTASACACIFACAGAIGVVVTVVLALVMPMMLPATFAGHVSEVQFVVLMLGLSCAISMPVAVYNGTITGNQRYDIVTVIEAGCLVAMLVCILVLLELGYGLSSMGIAVLVWGVVEGILKWRMAHRVCPALHLSARHVTRESLRDVTSFGAKTFVGGIGLTCLYQGNSLLVGFFLGPAAVAVLARSMVLVSHANKALVQFARVLTPLASSAQARGDAGELARVTLDGARFSLLLAIPVAAAMVVFAQPLMRVWMGAAYAGLPLLAILAATHFVSLSQVGSFHILMGLNRHGLPGIFLIGAAGLSLLATTLLLAVYHAGLVGVALSIGGSVVLANLVMVPLVARIIGLSLRKYLLGTVPMALLQATPFVMWIIASRFVFAAHDKLSLLIGLGGGAGVLLLSYWFWVLPQEMKVRILRRCSLSQRSG